MTSRRQRRYESNYVSTVVIILAVIIMTVGYLIGVLR